MRKLEETKAQISFAVTAKLISVFVYAKRILQSLYYLNPKFQASSHLLWLYSLVCVGPGRKPRKPVFSQRGSYVRQSQSGSFQCSRYMWKITYTRLSSVGSFHCQRHKPKQYLLDCHEENNVKRNTHGVPQ